MVPQAPAATGKHDVARARLAKSEFCFGGVYALTLATQAAISPTLIAVANTRLHS